MLGLPPLPRTLAAALRDITHRDDRVRASALRDLVRHARSERDRPEALAALERVLAADSKLELRADAAVALADADAMESRGALLRALDDSAGRVRQMALLALGEVAPIGDAGVVERVERLLAAPEPELRFQALVAIERLAPARADAAIAAAAGDADDEVRAMAFRLAERRFPSGSSPPARLLAAAEAALGDAVLLVRATAALFLAAREDERAYATLLGIIDGSVAGVATAELQAAIELTVPLRLTAAVPGLTRRAFGPFGMRSDPIAWHATVALARLGDERARRAILRRLDAWTHDARTLAVVAAGRAKLEQARPRLLSYRGDARRAAPEAVEEALRELDRDD